MLGHFLPAASRSNLTVQIMKMVNFNTSNSTGYIVNMAQDICEDDVTCSVPLSECPAFDIDSEFFQDIYNMT